jgi:hypothetical protein
LYFFRDYIAILISRKMFNVLRQAAAEIHYGGGRWRLSDVCGGDDLLMIFYCMYGCGF